MLTTLTFAQFQQLFATQYSAVAAIPANTNPGSTLGAIANADAILALNVQGELIYINGISRLATSFGADVDSFVNPFNVFRIQSGPSAGAVTCSTPSVATAQVVVPVGGIFSTANGLLFQIVADPTNSTTFFNAGLNGYVIAIGTSSCNVLVVCLTPGSIGNVQAGQISQIFGTSTTPSLAGISSVSNAAAFTSGIDVETDAALKTRFALLMSTGPVATANAFAAAILAVQAGLTYTIGDAVTNLNVAAPGFVSVFVNVNGSGVAAPGSLITAVQNSLVNNVKAAGITVNTYGPTLVAVTAAANLKIAAGFTAATVVAAALANLQTYLNGIGLDPKGAPTLAEISESYVVLRTTPGVANVTGLQLNSGTVDVAAAFGNQIIAGSITLTPF